ncbi:MAG: GSU3473 family protein [bacterium]
MLIRVRFSDDRYNMVKPWILDKLIEDQCLKAFLRRDGWVFPGKDKIRGMGGGCYQGRERRKKETPNVLPLACLLFIKGYELQLLLDNKGKGTYIIHQPT